MTEQQTTESAAMQSGNSGLQMQMTFAQIRLDTKELMTKIEEFLSNRRTFIVRSSDGEYREEIRQLGDPLANDEGIGAIMNMMYLMLNPQVVQGNFDNMHYWNYMEYIRKEMVNEIVLNRYEWEIKPSKMNVIIDGILRAIEPFMTRLINNEERKSYTAQFQSKETIQTGKGGLMGFAGGIGQ